MYNGATTELKPIPMPTIRRPNNSTFSVGASAETNAPTRKTNPASNSVRRRPIASASAPVTAEPTMHPSSTTLMVNSWARVSSVKSRVIKRIAPEITPVS